MELSLILPTLSHSLVQVRSESLQLPSFLVHKSSLQPHAFLLPTKNHNQDVTKNKTLITPVNNNEDNIKMQESLNSHREVTDQTTAKEREAKNRTAVNNSTIEVDTTGSQDHPIDVDEEEDSFIKGDDVQCWLSKDGLAGQLLID